MTGAGEIIKLARPETQIVVAEPENAALLSGKEWSPHKIQGWTPDFIPRVLKKEVADKFVPVSDDESIEAAKKLAKEEGVFTGISGGATLAACFKTAEVAPENSTFCVMLPDTGERYLSSPLFENITEDSDEDWLSSA